MQKYANLVELEKCCRAHILIIFLQNFVLIQPRTSPPKICKILQTIAKFANSFLAIAKFANSSENVYLAQAAARRRPVPSSRTAARWRPKSLGIAGTVKMNLLTLTGSSRLTLRRMRPDLRFSNLELERNFSNF